MIVTGLQNLALSQPGLIPIRQTYRLGEQSRK